MARRLRYKTWGTNPECVNISGSFAPAGSSAPTARVGKGVAVSRTGTGVFRLTYEESFNQLLGVNVTPQLAAASQERLVAVVGPHDSSNRTVDIYVYQESVGHLELDIFTAREALSNEIGTAADGAAKGSGGILASDTTPILERVSTSTDKKARVTWAATVVDEIQFSPRTWPADMDASKDATVNLRLAKNTNTDTAAVVGVYAFEPVGDTNFGGNTAALDSATEATYSVTLDASDIAGYPNAVNIGVIPGTHDNDAVYLYNAWVEYTKLTLADVAADANNRINFEMVFQASSLGAS